jgi:hypothetical protein
MRKVEKQKLRRWEGEKVGKKQCEAFDFGFGIEKILEVESRTRRRPKRTGLFLFKLPLPIAEKVLHQALNPD